jgi:hypothetical protein
MSANIVGICTSGSTFLGRCAGGLFDGLPQRAQVAQKSKARFHSSSELAATYSWGNDTSVNR